MALGFEINNKIATKGGECLVLTSTRQEQGQGAGAAWGMSSIVKIPRDVPPPAVHLLRLLDWPRVYF